MKATVTKEKFMDWYFSDDESIKDKGKELVNILINDNSVHYSVQDLFDECGYIPSDITEEGEKEDEEEGGMLEYTPNHDVILID